MDPIRPPHEASRQTASRVQDREEAQHRDERRYRQLFEAAQEGIAITTPDGRILDANPAVQAMLGYSREELRAMDATDLYVDPDERRRVIEEKGHQDAVRGLELRLRHKDGREIVARASMTVRRGSDGEIEAFETFLRDVTDEKRVEEALRESETKFRALAEESPTGITVIQDGRSRYVNKTYARIFGYEPEEMIDAFEVFEVVHPDDRAIVRENLRRRIEGEVESVRFQVRGLTKDERIIELEVSGRRFTYQGRPAVIGSVLDITGRKRAEEALRESDAKFRILAEKALTGITLLQEGVYRYVNPAFARITGYTAEELVGRSPDVLYHPTNRPKIRQHVRRCLAGEVDEAHYEARLVTKAGEVRTVEVLDSRLTYRGEPAVIGTILDITERRQLQREVLYMQEAERRRLGRDLHDGVASQLTGISIMLGVLARRINGADLDVEALAGDIQEIRALVDESGEEVRRLSRGLAPAGLSGKDLAGALERLAANTEGGQCEAEGDLTRVSDEAAAHLYWIAQEAVVNAQKYAQAERVLVRIAREADALVLEVEDDGRGFDPGRISEEDSLGLRTMRYRADLLGAQLSVETAPGEGTRVVCRLAI